MVKIFSRCEVDLKWVWLVEPPFENSMMVGELRSGNYSRNKNCYGEIPLVSYTVLH